MQSRNEIDFQKSRNGLTVPVINGVYLHSIYNPAKEANTFAENHIDLLKKKNCILILGLGYGYHIEEVAKILNQNHEHYSVVVIEHNKELLEEFNKNRPFLDKNIKVLCDSEIDNLYKNKYLVDMLLNKPGIIKLDTSFNLSKDYFKDFLTFKASNEIESYRQSLNPIASKLVSEYDESFHSIINKIKNSQNSMKKTDYLLLALSEIASVNNNEVTQ